MFMTKEKIDLKSLPFAEMERAGIRKDEFLNYPRQEIDRLLQGHRSRHCVCASAQYRHYHCSCLAHFSFRRAESGEVRFVLEKINDSMLVDESFLYEEHTVLAEGGIVRKTYADTKGYPVRVYHQLSPHTGEMLAVREDHIRLPHRILGRCLSAYTRSVMLNSDRPMVLDAPEGTAMFQLDLSCPCHFRVRIYRFKDKVKSFKNIIKCCGLFPINLVGLLLF